MTNSLFKQKLSPIKPGDPIDYKDVELLKKFITDRGKILPRRLTGLKGVKGSFANSAIADATAFDPFEGNISNLINEEAPFLKNVFTEALAQDEDAEAFQNRLRNAGEVLF